MITQYFQVVRGYDPLRAGVATLPFAIVTAAFSPVSIMLMKRFGTKVIVASGLVLMTSGFLVAATTEVDSSYWAKIVTAMALMAAGLALTTSPATEAIMGALPPGKAGAGSAVNDTTREVGGTLGVAIIGSVMNSAYGSHVLPALTRLGAPAAAAHAAGQSVVAGMITATHFPAGSQAAAAEAVRQAFMPGIHRGSFVAAIATAAAALLAVAIVPARAAATGQLLSGTDAHDSLSQNVTLTRCSRRSCRARPGRVPCPGSALSAGGVVERAQQRRLPVPQPRRRPSAHRRVPGAGTGSGS
jgi:hypothetical protein